MVTINFISAIEKSQRVVDSKILSSSINSQYEKLTRISYLDLDKSDIERNIRQSNIILKLYTVVEVKKIQWWLDPDSGSDDVVFQCYHTREFKFEAKFPGTKPDLEIFRYKDIDGFQYFTVINRNSNQIIEAGFIDRDLIGNGADVVIDVPDGKLNQFVLFPLRVM